MVLTALPASKVSPIEVIFQIKVKDTSGSVAPCVKSTKDLFHV